MKDIDAENNISEKLYELGEEIIADLRKTCGEVAKIEAERT